MTRKGLVLQIFLVKIPYSQNSDFWGNIKFSDSIKITFFGHINMLRISVIHFYLSKSSIVDGGGDFMYTLYNQQWKKKYY